VWAILSAVVALLSLLANGTALPALVVSQRGLVLFFAALFAQRAASGIYDEERRHALLVGAGVVSGGVCILQRLTVAASEPDRVTGLFALGEVVLFFHLIVLGLVLAYWTEGRRVGRWNAGFVVPWMVLSLAVGNQEAAFPYLGLLFLYFLVRARARRVALAVTGLVLGGGMLVVFAAFYDTQYRSDGKTSITASIFDRRYLQRYVFGERHDVFTPSGDLLRGAAVVTAAREIAADSRTLALGRGPGAASESAVAGASGPLATQFPGIGRVTLSMLLAEVGLLGLLVHLGFLLCFLWPTTRAGEPRERLLQREVTVLFALGFLVYVRLAYEPIFAWVLAGLVPPASSDRGRPGPSIPPSGELE
jgi:hypothetical protein